MKNVTATLLETTTDPFSVFSNVKENSAESKVIKENVVDAHVIEPSVNSIKEEFNRADQQDRILFLQSLIDHPETCRNLLVLMLKNPSIKQHIKNQFNDFSNQYTR